MIQHKIKHLAVIMDGNGRWAKQRHLPRIEGHRNGANAAKKLIENAIKHDIEYLTLYAFSSENWQRPQEEVQDLFNLLGFYIKNEIHNLHKNNIRIKFIGALDLLEPNLQKDIENAVSLTKQNNKITLCIAFSYGSRDEILNACKTIINEVLNNNLDIATLDLKDYLYDPEMPDVDLLIRTSGEQRISNFLLWQIAYAELYFTDVLWPDFGEIDLQKALDDFSKRKRTFGLRQLIN